MKEVRVLLEEGNTADARERADEAAPVATAELAHEAAASLTRARGGAEQCS